mgnify:FL=1
MARRSGGRGGWGGRGARGGYGGGRSSGRTSSSRSRLRPTFPRHSWTTTNRTANGGLRITQHSKLLPRQGGGFSSTQFKRDDYNPGQVAGAPDTTPPPAQRTSVERESGAWLGKPLRGRWLGKGTQPIRTPGKR